MKISEESVGEHRAIVGRHAVVRARGWAEDSCDVEQGIASDVSISIAQRHACVQPRARDLRCVDALEGVCCMRHDKLPGVKVVVSTAEGRRRHLPVARDHVHGLKQANIELMLAKGMQCNE